jgi:carboxyl-terminal processing protease
MKGLMILEESIMMIGKFQRIAFKTMAAALMISSVSSSAFALDCKQVRLLTQAYFKMHFTYTEFNDELSKRSLELFLRSWDPGKLYFLQSDVDRFERDYATKIDDAVNRADCSFIDDIVGTYGKRFEDTQKAINEAVAATHDFSVDEYMEVDRKKMPWAKTPQEIGERWRKRVKFQVLQLRETITDAP